MYYSCLLSSLSLFLASLAGSLALLLLSSCLLVSLLYLALLKTFCDSTAAS